MWRVVVRLEPAIRGELECIVIIKVLGSEMY